MSSRHALTFALVGAAIAACGGNVSLGNAGTGSGGLNSSGGPDVDGGPSPTADCSAPDACGPAPGMPAQTCPDGSIGGNTGRCVATSSGCGWEIRTCPPDTGACFDTAGVLDPTLKKCTSPSDCVVVEYQLNCCGTMRVTGVSALREPRVKGCAADRAATLPQCGCPALPTAADDGTQSTGTTTATVTCNAKGLCESTFDTACAGVTLPPCPAECATFPMTGSCTAGDKCRQAGSKIGDECSCNAGTWSCAVHPPLGPGCNLVCR